MLVRTVSSEREPGRAGQPPAGRDPGPSPGGRCLAAVFLRLERRPDRRRPGRCRGDDARRSRCKTPGGRRERTYRVYARTECVLCHNPWVEKKTTVFGVQSASPLGVNTPQLNRRDDDDESRASTSSRPCTSWDSWPGRPTSRSCRSWSIPTTSRPTSIAGRGRTSRRTARIATSSTPGARRTSRWATTCRSSDQDGRRPADPGDFQHRRGQDHRAGRSGALGAVLPRLQARRRPHAPRRLEPGRRARDPDDPRLDRQDAQAKSGDGPPARRSHAEDRDALECAATGRQICRPTARSAAIRRLASSTRGP